MPGVAGYRVTQGLEVSLGTDNFHSMVGNVFFYQQVSLAVFCWEILLDLMNLIRNKHSG